MLNAWMPKGLTPPTRSQLRRWSGRSAIGLLGLGLLGYVGFCAYLYVNQRHLLYEPRREILRLPSDPELRLPYQELLIPVRPWAHLHGWWIPAGPVPANPAARVLPLEPARSRSTIVLYLNGRSGNKSSMGYLRRVQALRQLGCSVLMIDYRGFGPSTPGWPDDWPSEVTLYEDAEAAWRYLVQVRKIQPANIVIYGESMGGAVAIDLASRHPEAGGLIAQSTFTTMAEAVGQSAKGTWTAQLVNWVPVDGILNQEFRSIDKIKSLQLPLLLIHGTADPVVPHTMSEALFAAAPEPKLLQLVPGGTHSTIYRSGSNSYVAAIDRFLTSLPPSADRSANLPVQPARPVSNP
jgi:uncharacterized protein